jgi:hypothetical protein
VQYFNGLGAIGDDFGDDDGWRAGLTVDYAITRGMSMKVSAQYNDRDGADDYVDGFVRLQRSF